jgi:hypothetical protein
MDDKRRIRDDSDELVRALDDLKATERAKREQDISTPRFHALADDVADKAHRVFEIAKAEKVDGERARTTDISTNEVPPSPESR